MRAPSLLEGASPAADLGSALRSAQWPSSWLMVKARHAPAPGSCGSRAIGARAEALQLASTRDDPCSFPLGRAGVRIGRFGWALKARPRSSKPRAVPDLRRRRQCRHLLAACNCSLSAPPATRASPNAGLQPNALARSQRPFALRSLRRGAGHVPCLTWRRATFAAVACDNRRLLGACESRLGCGPGRDPAGEGEGEQRPDGRAEQPNVGWIEFG
jgi:hypothetical protein